MRKSQLSLRTPRLRVPRPRAPRLLVAALLGATLGLAGCTTTDYGRPDVVRYLHDTYPDAKFRIAEEPQAFEDEEGYDDECWQVTDEDGVAFVVVNDYGWGMEWVTNSLRDNYPSGLLAALAQRYGTGSLSLDYASAWGAQGADVIDGAGVRCLSASVSSRAELERAYQDLVAFWGKVRGEAGPVGSMRFSVAFGGDVHTRPNGQEYDDWDVSDTMEDLEDMTFESFSQRYVAGCAALRYEDRLAEFSQDEIDAAIAACNLGYVFIQRADGSWEQTGLVDAAWGSYVSYGTLYELLRREGDVSELRGTPQDFSFVGADGSAYEFAYAMHDDETYYYLRDGEKVEALHAIPALDKDEVPAMSGLTLRLGE